MNLQGKTVIFLGDSITEGAAASSPEKIYLNVAARELGLGKAVNAGLSGTRIARQVKPSEPASFDEDFNKRADALSEKADLVVVFGGTNDYGHGDAPFGNLSDDTADTYCGACRRLFSVLTDKYGRGRVAAVTPMLRTDITAPKNGKTLADYAAVLRSMAEEFGVPVLDMQKNRVLDPSTEQGGLLFTDGLHPNDAGHEILGKTVAEFLRSIPEPQCPPAK